MKRTNFLIPVILALSLHPNARAQSIAPSIINASGSSASLGGNDYEWSVGEMVLISTFGSGSITVTQGLLQPSQVPEGVSQAPEIQVHLSVFPNPASSAVNISYSSQEPVSMSYTLTDMTGKTIMTGKGAKAASATQQLNIASLACAAYALDIFVVNESGSKHSIYKIDKTR